jgi:hypothetical protein
MDGGSDCAQDFPLSAHHGILLKSKTFVCNEGYDYQYLCDQNG